MVVSLQLKWKWGSVGRRVVHHCQWFSLRGGGGVCCCGAGVQSKHSVVQGVQLEPRSTFVSEGIQCRSDPCGMRVEDISARQGCGVFKLENVENDMFLTLKSLSNVAGINFFLDRCARDDANTLRSHQDYYLFKEQRLPTDLDRCAMPTLCTPTLNLSQNNHNPTNSSFNASRTC